MSNSSKSTKFFNFIKNLFIILIFLQFAPSILISLKDTIKDALVPKTNVGYLNITGLLENSTFYVKKMEEFSKDKDIKALLLRIESPGGLPGTSQAVFNAVKRFKKDKPVVVLIENVCASGGYYIACAGNHIISTPSAFVGSIGVYMQLPNVKDLLENWKIKFKYIQTGKYKTAGSPVKDISKFELDYFQELADANYEQFTKDVAESRKLDLNQADIWADGKVFLGSQALKLKLIDQLGGKQDAIDVIKKLAKITTEIKLITPKQPSAISKIFGTNNPEDETEQLNNFSGKMAETLSDIYNKFINLQETKSRELKFL